MTADRRRRDPAQGWSKCGPNEASTKRSEEHCKDFSVQVQVKQCFNVAMNLDNQLRTLKESLSDAQVLTDANTESFQTYLLRWSDIGLKTPRAIVLPRSELDCQVVVSSLLFI
jgi:hypothetical protein